MRACFSTLTRLMTPCVSHLSHLRGMRMLDFFRSTLGVGGGLSSVEAVWQSVGLLCRTLVGEAVEQETVLIVLLADL